MPWEESTDHIRSGHRSPSECQKGSMRTITISEEQGIKAIICRPPGSDSTVTQSFLFAKAKGWTLAKAKEWFSKHERASAALTVRYYVAAQAIERDGKKFALIEVIDESTCRNKWRINPAGKARALARLMEKPLIGPPVLGHAAGKTVGKPFDFVSNHATEVLYEIFDAEDWRRIDSREWGPVSPQLTVLASHYDEDGTLVVDEWDFDHVAFVPEGAFPRAGVKSTCIDDPRLCRFPAQTHYGFSRALTAALDSESSNRWQDVGAYSPEKGKQGSRKQTRGPPGGVTVKKDNECEEKIAQLTETKEKLEAELEDLKAKAAELTETNTKLDAELKELKAKDEKVKAASPPEDAVVTLQAEMKAVKAENETLKAWKAAQEEADHMRRVQGVVDLRIKAGLLDAKNVQAAVDALKKLPNEALDAICADLEAVQGKFDSLPSGPKARLIPSAGARFNPMQPTVGDLVGKKPGEA